MRACVLAQVIVEKVPRSQILDIDKRKYLLPSDISVAQFMYIIRKRIQLPPEKAIFLFVGKVLPQTRSVGGGSDHSSFKRNKLLSFCFVLIF